MDNSIGQYGRRASDKNHRPRGKKRRSLLDDALFFTACILLGLIGGAGYLEYSRPPGRPGESSCARNLDCAAQAGLAVANAACGAAIAAATPFPVEWTDPHGKKFSRYRWQSGPGGPIVYQGDYLVLPDSGGVYVNHKYECTVDPDYKKVLQVALTPGRLGEP